MSTDLRPLSPHLSIYRPQISSVLSIAHRITGAALYGGTALIIAWLWIAAYAPSYYPALQECLSSWWGKLLLLGWMFSFYFHFANGIRHLFWDAGYGFSLPQMHRSGWLVVVFSFIMTAASWGFISSGLGQ